MKAAVIERAAAVPAAAEFAGAEAGEGEVDVHVSAAALKPLDRSIVAGSHYSSQDVFPRVCGVDGVGRLADGARVYFGGCRPPHGSMAERTVVSRRWCLPLPDTLDDLTAAALPNPAMSAWMALTWAGALRAGERVLILGATGVAGRLAIQVARHLGAGSIVAAGRDLAALPDLVTLGASNVVAIGDAAALGEAVLRLHTVQPFDVVVDYLWGDPTAAVLAALTHDDLMTDGRPIRWIQVGESAGATIDLPAGVLRGSGVRLFGSGGGSVPIAVLAEALPTVIGLGAAGVLTVAARPVPLRDVATEWGRKRPSGERVVFVP